MNKKQKNNTYAILFTAAARRLGVSVCTVQRLVKKGILHATEPQLRRHHWTRGIRVDKAFEAERARRLNGLKAPRRKHIPAAIDPLDPSPIQTVTDAKKNELTQAAMLERAENAMSICNMARNACQEIKDSITRYQHEVDAWAMEKVRTIQASEDTCTRCTAVLAAACVLQLLLAVYYTLCHFNII